MFGVVMVDIMCVVFYRVKSFFFKDDFYSDEISVYKMLRFRTGEYGGANRGVGARSGVARGRSDLRPG
jgi:hypothetical protein